MKRKIEQVDFCINCLNIKDCFYCKNKKEPVHFCEEFTCKDLVLSRNDIERLKRAQVMSLPVANPGLFDDCGKLS